MAVKPDPRSQSSEEYAHSLLAQKQERDDRNFYHAKKQDRKATKKARLGLLGAWGTQAWNRRNFQKAQNLEESMIWEIASRTSDHNKAVADADTFIKRQKRWEALGGEEIGAREDANNYYINLVGGADQMELIKHRLSTEDPDKLEALLTAVNTYADNLLADHRSDREVVNELFGTTQESIIASVRGKGSPIRRKIQNDNIFSATARWLGLIPDSKFQDVRDYLSTYEKDFRDERASEEYLPTRVREAMQATADAGLPLDMADYTLPERVKDHGFKEARGELYWVSQRGLQEPVAVPVKGIKSIGDLAISTRSQLMGLVRNIRLKYEEPIQKENESDEDFAKRMQAYTPRPVQEENESDEDFSKRLRPWQTQKTLDDAEIDGLYTLMFGAGANVTNHKKLISDIEVNRSQIDIALRGETRQRLVAYTDMARLILESKDHLVKMANNVMPNMNLQQMAHIQTSIRKNALIQEENGRSIWEGYGGASPGDLTGAWDNARIEYDKYKSDPQNNPLASLDLTPRQITWLRNFDMGNETWSASLIVASNLLGAETGLKPYDILELITTFGQLDELIKARED